MRVFVYLTVFSSDINNNTRCFILLKDNDILTLEMKDDSPSSFSIIENMVKESMNITGRWAESMPRLVGILDDENMKIDNERIIGLVYSLYMSSKNQLNNGYRWVSIDELENTCQSDISKNIIRYAAISI